MSASDRTATDAVMILESFARILRASPNAISADEAETQAAYVDDAAGAVIRDAKLDAEELGHARAYGGREWDSALLNILFPDDQVDSTYARIHYR